MGNEDVNVDSVKQITEMGFAEDQAVQALQVGEISSRFL